MQAARTAQTARLRAVHPILWAAFAALATGAVLCVIGWYGISGERFAERQLPYLASCTVPGAALIVAGAVLLTHGRNALAAARVEELYGLLVATGPEAPGERAAQEPVATSDDLMAVPGGTLWHRADCPLVSGKAQAVPLTAAALADGSLTPCPICEPPSASGGGPPSGPVDGLQPGPVGGPPPGPAGEPPSGPMSGPHSGPDDEPQPGPAGEPPPGPAGGATSGSTGGPPGPTGEPPSDSAAAPPSGPPPAPPPGPAPER